MSDYIAARQGFAPPIRSVSKSHKDLANSEHLAFRYDGNARAFWAYISESAPAYISYELLQELLDVANFVVAISAVTTDADFEIDFRVLASKRRGVFSLGGDIAAFRMYIEKDDKDSLLKYARAAIDAIYANMCGSEDNNLTTVALVQGEAQGGGFEAAISSHFLIAEKGSYFGFPEALFGLFPGMGGFDLVAARASVPIARKLIGSTNRYSAEMLYELGVVDMLAEKGEGEDKLVQWMSTVSPEETLRYRRRFDGITYEQLLATVEQWVEQAAQLDSKQLRTMGYIVEAQRRASEKPRSATVTVLRRPISFEDLNEQSATLEDGAPVIQPKKGKPFAAADFLSLVRRNEPWFAERVRQNGALVLRGFGGSGADWMEKIAAALKYSLQKNVASGLFEGDKIGPNTFALSRTGGSFNELPHNIGADATVWPEKLLIHWLNRGTGTGTLRLADTGSLAGELSTRTLEAISSRGIQYVRRYPDQSSISRSLKNAAINAACWQQLFGSNEREAVETWARTNGCSVSWLRKGGVEIANESPGFIAGDSESEYRWFNNIFSFDSAYDRPFRTSRIFRRVFGDISGEYYFEARFGDGSIFPSWLRNDVRHAYERSTRQITLVDRDIVLINNLTTAHAIAPIGKGERVLISSY